VELEVIIDQVIHLLIVQQVQVVLEEEHLEAMV
jgi:hypothetical protein